MLQKFCHKSPEKEKPGGAGCASALGLTSNLLRKRNNNNVNIRDFFLLWCGDFFHVMGLFRDNHHTLLYTHGPPTLMMGEKVTSMQIFYTLASYSKKKEVHQNILVSHLMWTLPLDMGHGL